MMKINTGVAVGLRKAIRLLGLTAGALLLCVPLFSQGNTGRILGTITDQTGGSVAGATVTVTDVQRGVSRALITDQAGEYSAPNLLPSMYTVRAEYKGFKSVERPNILLEVGKELRIDLTMQPGEITQTVTVTEQAPLLETTNAALGGTISNQTINELPLNGRNYENLLALRPGVTIYPGGGGWTQSTNGVRPEDNVYIVDGVNDNEPFSGMSVLNGAPLAGDASTSVPIDAIQEFNTQQNPKAEYGWKPGAIVNVGLKSGTNSLHGTAYAFGRDGAWDARDYFNYASAPECKATPAQCDKAPVAVEQFGATAGGPIKKDKLFFFAAYEGQRYNVGSIYPDKSPSLVPGAGIEDSMPDTLQNMVLTDVPISTLSLNLAGCPTPPTTGTSPAWATYKCTGQDLAGSAHAQIFPVNLSTALGTAGTTFIPGLISTNSQNNGLAKIDYHISDHHSLSGMYFFGQNDGTWNDNGNQLVPIDQSFLYTRAQVGSGGWVWTPSSQWVNELRGGVDHLFQPTQGVDFNVNPATGYGINTGVTNPAYFGMPQIRIFSFGNTTFSIGQGLKKQQGPDDVYQLMDHVSYLRGNHAIKFGAEFIDNKGTDAGFSTDKGRIDFADLTNFFEGVPRTKTGGQILSGNPLTTVSSQGYALFVQDDWRIRPRVMINLGLRYELDTVLHSANNQLGNFLPNLGLVQVGKQISSIYNGDHNNFAPRVGIAWDVNGNGKTVVRAGGSIIYEVLPFNVFTALSNTLGLQTVPTGAVLVVNGATIPSPGTIAINTVPYPGASLNWNGVGGGTIFPTGAVSCGDSIGTDPPPCAIMAINPNLRTPYVSTWIVGVQRAITNSLSVDASYIGNHGTKLIGFTDMNQPKTAGGALPFATQFPYLSYINQLSNLYLSNYNGLQVTLTQRISHGLSFVAGYTYSHALDDSSHNWEGGIPLNSYQPKLEYASSDFDIRNRFTLSTTYDIPGIKSPLQLLQGWEINSIVTLQGGQPWGPADLTNDFSGTGEVSNPSAVGEWWNFFGNPADFKSNQNPIPFFGSAPFPAACTAHAALADLNSFGCYMKGNSVLVPPAAGTYGNSGRGIFRDQGFRDWDFSVIKGWKLQERLTTQFRAEFFNILNHPIFTNPYGGSNGYGVNDPSSPGTPAIPGVASQAVGFGCGCATPDTAASNPVLGSGSNRAIQLGLKLIF